MTMKSKLEQYDQKSAKVRGKLAKSHAEASLSSKENELIHGTYQFENLMLSYIRDGEVQKLRTLLARVAEQGEMTQGKLASDPLRQAKNLLIGFVAVVGKVAGIGGGMDVEDAYRLIDLYTQECEKAQSVEDVYLLQYNMVLDFTEKVAQAKLPQGISKETFSAIQFIQNHTNAQIGIDDVADAVGKSRSALTRQFKEETGKTITEFITESKLRDAKRLLRYSDMTLSEIASSLAFSSQSYFQTVFKARTGLTPMEYRRKNNPLF